ncbi:hypothetical protein LSM04_005430 [Trypanosoma melophagium]|uniref:uncharacterized protein n=1 Tax=Trypanosoma melophagium TaxID=715481 RepID=UPI00351A7B54|nr:hypothetical protein LSM04_005430 [Trypanosoma melophagium]
MEFRTVDQRLKLLHGQHDVSERLDELQDAVALLRQRQEQQGAQWQAVSAEQRQHCSDLASMYQQLQELLAGGWEGDENARMPRCAGAVAKAVTAPLTTMQTMHDALSSELRDVLLNFRQHIERHTAATNQRLEDMQKSIDRIEGTVEGNRDRLTRQEECIARLEQQQLQLQQRVSSTPLLEDVQQLQRTLGEQLGSVREELAAAVQRQRDGVEERLASHKAQCSGEQSVLRREALQSIDEAVRQLREELDAVRRNVEAQTAYTDATLRVSEERTRCHIEETLNSHVKQTCEQIHAVHSELSGKHLELVEDTMEAVEKIAQVADGLPGKVTLLQEDVASIHETLRRHGEVLNEQCLQGSLQGAFDEVKDWLQDLERRVPSRGELDEVLAGVDDRLAALRREFIIRGPVEELPPGTAEDAEGNAGAGPK